MESQYIKVKGPLACWLFIWLTIAGVWKTVELIF